MRAGPASFKWRAFPASDTWRTALAQERAATVLRSARSGILRRLAPSPGPSYPRLFKACGTPFFWRGQGVPQRVEARQIDWSFRKLLPIKAALHGNPKNHAQAMPVQPFYPTLIQGEIIIDLLDLSRLTMRAQGICMMQCTGIIGLLV